MRQLIIILIFTITSTSLSAQKFGAVDPNRFTYIHLAGGNPYMGGKIGYELRSTVYLEGQAFTDGGGIWNSSSFNDWRSFSLLKAYRIQKLRTEIRGGMGIVQTSEKLFKQGLGSFGMAPQIGAYILVTPEIGIGASYTHPLTNVTNTSSAFTVGIEYRIGRYEPDDGLY